MPQPQYDIFISYRREDGKDFARHMQLKLQNYGYSVFLDFDELKDGTFDRRIMDAIESAPVFMVILSPHALDRCRDKRDWVRREIEHAIMHDRHIVPVNPDREFAGFPEDCPSSIRVGLGQHQFTEIFTGQQFTTTVDDMVRIRIRPVLEKKSRAPREEIGAIIHIETDVDCRVLKFGKEIGLARAGEDMVIRLRKVKHKLEFVSTENPSDRSPTIFAVEDNEMEDFLQVELADIRAARLEAERREQERIEYERRCHSDKDICRFDENGKIGFEVKSTGEVLIPLKYDNAPAKLIKKLNKEGVEKPVLKAACVQECAFVGADKLDELASIKSKEELIGDIIGMLQSPIKNVISALQNAGGHDRRSREDPFRKRITTLTI